jgi:hypothetical protein
MYYTCTFAILSLLHLYMLPVKISVQYLCMFNVKFAVSEHVLCKTCCSWTSSGKPAHVGGGLSLLYLHMFLAKFAVTLHVPCKVSDPVHVPCKACCYFTISLLHRLYLCLLSVAFAVSVHVFCKACSF